MAEIKSSAEITAKFIASFGKKGEGPGEFKSVCDVAISPRDYTVFVASSNRVQVYTADGRFVRRFAKQGKEAGQIYSPNCIAFDNDRVIISESFGDVHRVQMFKHDDTFVSQIGHGGEGSEPYGVAAEGLIFVADQGNDCIQCFNRAGSFVRAFGERGSGDGEFRRPYGIAIAPTGELVVSDGYNHRIQVFTIEGKFIRKFGSEGRGNGQFHYPGGICFDRAGRLLVADTNNHRVQVLSLDGQFIAAFGEKGSGDGQFDGPYAVCLDGSGRLLIADYNNCRVQIWSLGQSSISQHSVASSVFPVPAVLSTPAKSTTSASAQQQQQPSQQPHHEHKEHKAQPEHKAKPVPVSPSAPAPPRVPLSPLSVMSAGVTEVKLAELTLEKELGAGGFGRVWMGTWRPMGSEKVAIKKLHASVLSEEAEQQFSSEVHIMLSLRHPNIVNIYGACLERGNYCIVLELCGRGSLFHVLHSKTPLSFLLRVRLMIDSARGLMVLHSKNIIHRDIKSPNVLVTTGYRAKLADFGMAKAKTETATTTKASKAISLPWTAPELLTLRPKHTAESDVYAFGVLLFEIATGLTPYEGADDSTVRELVKKGEREEIPAEAKVPKELAELIARCWHQEPGKRPKMPEVVAELEKLLPPGAHVLLPTADEQTALLHQILQEAKQAKEHAASASDGVHIVKEAVLPSKQTAAQLPGYKPV